MSQPNKLIEILAASTLLDSRAVLSAAAELNRQYTIFDNVTKYLQEAESDLERARQSLHDALLAENVTLSVKVAGATIEDIHPGMSVEQRQTVADAILATDSPILE